MQRIPVVALLALAFVAPASGADQAYLRLEARLDRPEDGYCLDVAGEGRWVDLSVPLAAHNCKLPERYPTSSWRSPGRAPRCTSPPTRSA